MSPWDLIGWLIAIPLVFMTVLFSFAMVIGLTRYGRKQAKGKKSHLKLVDD
jgi:hypothetical protein